MSAIARCVWALCTAAVAADETRLSADELQSLDRNDDQVVSQVGEIALRASDVYRVMDLAAPSLAGEILREMVLTSLAQLEGRREGVDVPVALVEAETQRAMAEQKARFALEVDAVLPLETFLQERHGMSPESYRSEVRRMVHASLLLERVVRLHAWRQVRDELELILVEEEDLARALRAQLDEGASFAVLARKHSVHPSAEDGGLLPELSLDMELPLVEGRQGLQPGEILGPAPITLDGKDDWRLLRLVERRGALDGDWAALRERVEASLADRPLMPQELAAFEAQMRDRYRVQRPPSPP